jgi:hypothetical protein
MGGATLWAIFSQTRPVNLVGKQTDFDWIYLEMPVR